ncbi:Pls/PosA family non-ribosomal peptide synthetase [Longispora albida]|uniref:Pls/PosA family non-ribosomal peptide synthetase n=1 Tax=Longispora albida TaxID=203523 RepID=UPI000366FA0A|nr:Pls/PosA family non-ribosomal peptide synthetase [Longispora albida]
MTTAITEVPAVFPGVPAPPERTLLGIFEATVAAHPNAAALDAGTGTLSYRRLAEEAGAVAQRLRKAGVGAGHRVGVRIASGTAELYVAILGVLTAGAAYVPVDADDPDERAELVFGEAGVSAILTDGGTLTPVEGAVPGTGNDAWIIFTSGSTGKPKGVAVSHRSAAAFVDAEARLFCADEPLGPGDRVLAGLSVAFDASCEEMWLAWRHGACLVPAPRALVRSGVDLGPWLVERGITVVSTVPTLASLWPVDALEEIRLLIFGGEACPPELAERLAVEGREVWNTYGPTEATVVATAARLTGTGPVRIGLALDGWELAVVGPDGQPVPMGETGELVIGGVGLARYLDPEKDAEKYAPLESLGWERAYRSGDIVRAEPEGLLFMGRGDEQVKLGGRRIELGEVDAALMSLPEVTAAAAAVQRTRAGNQVLVGYVVASDSFDSDRAVKLLRKQLPAALVPLLARVPELPVRTSGKVDRKALPWPLSTTDIARSMLTGTQAWLAEAWSEILGVQVVSPKADFFSNGGGSLSAAQLVAHIRSRYPQVAIVDIYQNPALGGLAAFCEGLEDVAGTRPDVAPVPRKTGFVQTLLMVPLLTLAGLRWSVVALALANLLDAAWAPHVSWWWLLAAWVVLFSPPGRIGLAAGGARLLLRGVKPGSYPRGGSVHIRLWAAEKLQQLSGVTSVSGASWMTFYAKALGAKVGKDTDLHSAPPVTGMLKLGRGAAVEPETDLSGHWVDGDRVHIGKIRIGAGARVGGRSTLLPGTRIGKSAEIGAGSTVRGVVPAGQRWAGSPAAREDAGLGKWPVDRPGRTRLWSAVYGLSSLLLGLLPLAAAVPALVWVAPLAEREETLAQAWSAAMLVVPLAAISYFLSYGFLVLVGVRLLSIRLREGYHGVHSRVAWQAWATERLMGMARTGLFPLYASLATPAWLRLLGAKVGRGAEVSTVLALPSMTRVADGAFLADDTMVASYELGYGWLHIGQASVGKQAFLGNSGMTGPGRSVPKGGLVGVLSATPRKTKKGGSYLGMPPMAVRRAVETSDVSRTFEPPFRLKLARALMELLRIVPVMCSAALAVTWLALVWWLGPVWGPLASGLGILAGGVLACLTATVMKWLLVGRFREVDHPLWSSFVWRNELADTFVEVLAVTWLAGAAGGTPLLTGWLRTMGARIGRGVWLETYWLPESDLVRLGAGATVNRGCVVQTHLFHDRIMSMSAVEFADGATLGPHGIVLPGASIGARTTVGPGSLVTRGDAVPADSRWLGNPIAVWAKR